MSNSMERNKNESIAAKEQEEEEEEMKRELLDMGMYESGYTYKEMKDILGFISESKNMANLNNDNKNMQKDLLHSSNECPTEAHKTNLMQELDAQEHSNTNRSIHSYRPNRSSPILDRISAHEASSPETTSIFESRSLPHRRKSSDSEEMFDRIHNNQPTRDTCPNSATRYSLRSRNALLESPSMHAGESKLDTQSEQNTKLDRWRINPLDCCTNEGEVPLCQADRPPAEDREPLKFCKDAQDATETSPDELEKVLIALNLHLKETADLWHSWHRTTDYKFQWGSPIQVGTPNGSLDKKQISNARTDPVAKSFDERASKRKMLSSVSAHLMLSSDEDKDEADFVSLKKKKVQSHKRQCSNFHHKKKEPAKDSTLMVNKPSSEDQSLERHNTWHSSSHNTSTQKLEPNANERETSIAESSRSHGQNLFLDALDSSPEIEHKKSDIAQVRKESDLQDNNRDNRSTEQSVKEKKNISLREDVILSELNKDSDEENAISPKKQDIKPLPMKRLSVRLEKSCSMLKKYQAEEQKKKEALIEENRMKQEREQERMREAMKHRAEEIQKKYKEREEAEKLEREKSSKWNNVLQLKNKETKERLRAIEQEARLPEIVEGDPTRSHPSGGTSGQDEEAEDLIECVSCPICNRSFPTTDIELHAASCEQYNSDDDDTVSVVPTRRPSRICKKNVHLLECNICSKFKTVNGIDYEEHVTHCLRNKQAQEDSESCGYTNVDIHEIPSSPIRCFRPISEQNDTEIDYRAQFASTSRAQPTRGRKRKR